MHQLLVSTPRPRFGPAAPPTGAHVRRLPWMLMFALVACGGSENSSGGDAAAGASLARVDACNLLSPAEVGAVLGTAVEEPNRREAGDETTLATICVYDGGWPNNVNITVRQNANAGRPDTSGSLAAEFNQDLDAIAADSSMADLVEGGRWVPLDLQGHAAAIRDAGEGGWTAVVRKDGVKAVEVLINAPTREAAMTLAGSVMERLSTAP